MFSVVIVFVVAGGGPLDVVALHSFPALWIVRDVLGETISVNR